MWNSAAATKVSMEPGKVPLHTPSVLALRGQKQRDRRKFGFKASSVCIVSSMSVRAT